MSLHIYTYVPPFINEDSVMASKYNTQLALTTRLPEGPDGVGFIIDQHTLSASVPDTDSVVVSHRHGVSSDGMDLKIHFFFHRRF